MKWFDISLFLVIILVVACQSNDSLMEKADETGDWNYCLKINSEMRQLSCLKMLTERSDTPVEMCLVYGDNENGKNMCYYNLAKYKDDISVCDMMTNSENAINSRDDCYWEFSYDAFPGDSGADPTVCEKIEDDELKHRCINLAS